MHFLASYAWQVIMIFKLINSSLTLSNVKLYTSYITTTKPSFTKLVITGFFVPFIYLPDKAISMGSDPKQAAFLLSILGITNTVGRVVSGWVSDR